jgi:hypothetical protein
MLKFCVPFLKKNQLNRIDVKGRLKVAVVKEQENYILILLLHFNLAVRLGLLNSGLLLTVWFL